MAFKLHRLYHPSHRVPDLQEADNFFNDVFGIESVWRSSLYTKPNPKFPNYPTDYCIFTTIADVFFDCIDPKRYVIDGVQRYETVEKPQLNGFGWLVDGIDHIFQAIQTIGVVPTDQANRECDSKQCPKASFNDSKLFYTTPESSGIRLEFYPVESAGSYDPRTDPQWRLSPDHPKGSLGVQYCSHHTILTKDPERALRIYCDALGGQKISEETETPRGTYSTFVAIADGVLEIAEPRVEGSDAWHAYASRSKDGCDVYYCLTWKVESLAQVRNHLSSKGIQTLLDSETMLIMDPAQGLGIPWGFVEQKIPGDSRYG